MAVVSVEQLFEGRSGSDNLERKRDYVQTWEVLTDDDQDDATVAGGTALLPRNGESHPNDPWAVMVAIDPVQDSASPRRWIVTCRFSSSVPTDQQREALTYDSSGVPSENAGYSTGGGTGGGGNQMSREDNPLDRPAQISMTWEKASEVLRRDQAGVAIKNSAGDPFDPPPMVERSYPVLTIKKNIPLTSDFLKIENQVDYQEAINSDTPWGRTEGTLTFSDIEYSSEIENGIAYAAASLRIRVRWQGWDLELVDAGHRESAANGGRWFGKDPETGATPDAPRMLDGAGAELPQGDPLEVLTFQWRRPIAFIPVLALLGITA